MSSVQLRFDDLRYKSGFSPDNGVLEAMELLASTEEPAVRGAVATQEKVVNFILDLVGYSADKKLWTYRILEPSFGNGDFLLIIIRRLLESWHKRADESQSIVEGLLGSVREVEIHRETYKETKEKVVNLLYRNGLTRAESLVLVDSWLIRGDFLILQKQDKFDYVVGNPPYLRQEVIPAPLLREYRRLYKTMYDRADIYVPFFEKSLGLLTRQGKLGFICSDRWTKNRYGGPLRKLVFDGYNLMAYIDMVGTESFLEEVSVYPAITIISREKQGVTRAAFKPEINKQSLRSLSRQLTTGKGVHQTMEEVTDVIKGSEPWLFGCNKELGLLRKLEAGHQNHGNLSTYKVQNQPTIPEISPFFPFHVKKVANGSLAPVKHKVLFLLIESDKKDSEVTQFLA